MGHAAVVLQHPAVPAGVPVAGDAQQRAVVAQVQLGQQRAGAQGSVDEVLTAEQPPGVD